MRIIEVEYKKTGGKWTFVIINHNSGLSTRGDNYPGSKRGLEMAKRDAADIIRHLRKTNQIKVKR